MLPNLIIIGAHKAGTSALHTYLRRHPEVFMSTPKELNFFSRPSLELPWYERHFEKAVEPVRGESSPQYTIHPITRRVPERMHAVVPDAKLIYLVRDPIERIVAHWTHFESTGFERRRFEELADAEAAERYLLRSRYATQLEQYLPYYDLDRILVIDRDDLLDRRRETLRRVFAFLGVDETFDSPRFDDRVNVTVEKRRMKVRGPLIPTRVTQNPKKLRRPRALRKRVRRALLTPLSEPVQVPTPTPEHRAMMVEQLAPEVERLRAMTGQAFAGWSV